MLCTYIYTEHVSQGKVLPLTAVRRIITPDFCTNDKDMVTHDRSHSEQQSITINFRRVKERALPLVSCFCLQICVQVELCVLFLEESQHTILLYCFHVPLIFMVAECFRYCSMILAYRKTDCVVILVVRLRNFVNP